MRAREFITEKWSEEYKRSINCDNPKGFSQRAHCQGRKKNHESVDEDLRTDNPCWKGYKPVGTKKKAGRTVPNCVPVEEEQLDELTFHGSQCTKDCSGHRAGYEWYKRKGRPPLSRSNSFNKGAAIAARGI